jgi:hypothetical protein
MSVGTFIACYRADGLWHAEFETSIRPKRHEFGLRTGTGNDVVDLEHLILEKYLFPVP